MCWNPAHRGGQTAKGSWGDLQEDHPPGVRPRGGGELGPAPQPCIDQVGGLDGMKLFVQTPEFKAMNVGFGLDEGIAGPGEELPLFYGERNVFWVRKTR